MENKRNPKGISRRDFLKLGGLTAFALAGSSSLAGRMLSSRKEAIPPVGPARLPDRMLRLAATDGYLSFEGRRDDPVYTFGFIRVPDSATIKQLDVYKGRVQVPSPLIATDEGSDHYLVLTNIGLETRPDLDDSHTIHWHGFRNPNSVMDGVPEVSIAVPVARDFPYFFRPRDEGTYMYHCHFEDTEHVQMQMDGIVYVRPGLGNNYAYNHASTVFDREFAFLLNEIDTRPHDLLRDVQEFVWSEYDPNYWVINGRSYPDTLLPNNDPSLPSQPLSSLIQVEEGDRALLRFANLGYQIQSIQLLGMRMLVIGEDATFLRGPTGANLTYETSTIYIGPGEAKDVIIHAPTHSGTGDYNTYWLRNRNAQRLKNGTEPGMGGQVTQVQVYPSGALGPQTHPNQTYPENSSPAPYLDPWII